MLKAMAESEKWTWPSPRVGALSFQLEVVSFLPAGATCWLLQPVTAFRQSLRPSGFCLAPVGVGKCEAVLAFPKCTEKCNWWMKRTEGEKNLCQINMEIQQENPGRITLVGYPYLSAKHHRKAIFFFLN